MISIKHRFTDATLCEFNVATMKDAVVKAAAEKANLDGADLRGADLRRADLRRADLRGADLRCANLDGEKITKNPLSIVGMHYWCLISDSYMRLGCKRFTHQEWSDFNDGQISEMDSKALEFWTQWKAPLLEMCKTHAPK